MKVFVVIQTYYGIKKIKGVYSVKDLASSKYWTLLESHSSDNFVSPYYKVEIQEWEVDK